MYPVGGGLKMHIVNLVGLFWWVVSPRWAGPSLARSIVNAQVLPGVL